MKEIKYEINGSTIIVKREAEKEGQTVCDAIIKSLILANEDQKKKER